METPLVKVCDTDRKIPDGMNTINCQFVMFDDWLKVGREAYDGSVEGYGGRSPAATVHAEGYKCSRLSDRYQKKDDWKYCWKRLMAQPEGKAA
jgi:hypothetical protein